MLPINNISIKLGGKGPLKTIKSQKDISSVHSLLLLAHLSSIDSLLLPKTTEAELGPLSSGDNNSVHSRRAGSESTTRANRDNNYQLVIKSFLHARH